MGSPQATGAIVPPKVSPEQLEPLVTVVAVLGELGATRGDIPLAEQLGSLRAGLVALIGNIERAMGHRHGDATRLRHALATAGATKATTGASTGTTAVPPGDSAVPRATAGDAWATVATIARKWREAVASVEATWAKVAEDAMRLRDGCRAVATPGATTPTTVGHLVEAVAQQTRAHQELVEAAWALPMASELAAVASEVTSHRSRVAEASERFRLATEATERTAVAMEETMKAGWWEQQAVVALGPLGRLVAACQRATGFYRDLRCFLEGIEATVAATAAGHGGPEAPGVAQEGPGGPRATMTTQGGPGGPEDLMALVTVAEALWEASGRLAHGHLLETLRVARRLVVNPGGPDATVATAVAQRCRDATAALPGLLRP